MLSDCRRSREPGQPFISVSDFVMSHLGEALCVSTFSLAFELDISLEHALYQCKTLSTRFEKAKDA